MSRSKDSRPSFPPPLARPKNPPSPVHKRPRSFRTIKAESFLIITGPGVNTVTSLSGRSLLSGTPSSYADTEEQKSFTHPSNISVINATGPCPSPKRPKTPGIHESTAFNSDENGTKSEQVKRSNNDDVLSKPAESDVPVSGDNNSKRPATPGTPMNSRRPSTSFVNRRSWTPRPLSSTSCASSVSLRAYFSGDTVEDLFPGVKIGKVNLPKATNNILKYYPEGNHCLTFFSIIIFENFDF